jgi:hypothetical protein
MNRRWPRTAETEALDQTGEPLAVLHAEVLLLREENARLRGAQHQRAELARLLGRARALPDTASDTAGDTDTDTLGDEAAQMLIDGLVIRESLLELCEEIERAMVGFGARLEALASPAVEQVIAPLPRASGNGKRHSYGNGNGNGNGHGPTAA